MAKNKNFESWSWLSWTHGSDFDLDKIELSISSIWL